MFESAELGHRIDKETWNKEMPALRDALLDAQYDLVAAKKFPVIIIIAGVDGSGKSAVVSTLNEWMDPRHIQVNGLDDPSDEELERPHMWRYWRLLPPKGKMGIFDGSLYSWPILQRANGIISNERLDQDMEQVRRFEQMLIDEGALVLKFWMHLAKKTQHKRLTKLEKDPKTRWRHGSGLEALQAVRHLPPSERAGPAHHQHRGSSLDRGGGHGCQVPAAHRGQGAAGARAGPAG
jgi:polyphosphate kinase 2 (PPK2 family)